MVELVGPDINCHMEKNIHIIWGFSMGFSMMKYHKPAIL